MKGGKKFEFCINFPHSRRKSR